MSERVLVNFFYAYPVGHAVEALHYAHGHHRADPTREVSVALNAETAVELADLCPWVQTAYAIDHPFLEPGPGPPLTLPREWDWVLDDPRRYQPIQTELFPGLRDYYAATDAHLTAARARTIAGPGRCEYLPHQPLRFDLAPAPLEGGPWIAVMPAGSSESALYPSLHSWELILEHLPEARIALIGKTGATSFDLEALQPDLSAVDLPITQQLAIVKACDLFLSPHTGFGLAALATGTPWLTISGGRWFEYYFNHVPFRSILPDVTRYPAFSQFEPALIQDGRTPSMSDARIGEDRHKRRLAKIDGIEREFLRDDI